MSLAYSITVCYLLNNLCSLQEPLFTIHLVFYYEEPQQGEILYEQHETESTA